MEKLILLVIDQRPIQRECYWEDTWYGRSQPYSQKEIYE